MNISTSHKNSLWSNSFVREYLTLQRRIFFPISKEDKIQKPVRYQVCHSYRSSQGNATRVKLIDKSTLTANTLNGFITNILIQTINFNIGYFLCLVIYHFEY